MDGGASVVVAVLMHAYEGTTCSRVAAAVSQVRRFGALTATAMGRRSFPFHRERCDIMKRRKRRKKNQDRHSWWLNQHDALIAEDTLQCSYCDQPIAKGDRYSRQYGLLPGDFENPVPILLHYPCELAWSRLRGNVVA